MDLMLVHNLLVLKLTALVSLALLEKVEFNLMVEML